MVYSFVDAAASVVAEIALDGHESEIDFEMENRVVIAGFAYHGVGAREKGQGSCQTLYGFFQL